jgi:hypothetical protein
LLVIHNLDIMCSKFYGLSYETKFVLIGLVLLEQ